MTMTISLTQGKVAIVDAADYERVSQFKWHASRINGHWYASTNTPRPGGPPVVVRMHRLILAPPPGVEVDHKNGDGLDNRRANLRPATHVQNLWNQRKRGGSSRFIGVSLDRGRWRAVISRQSRSVHVGSFSREVEAAIAYDKVCRRLRGAFARPNFSAAVSRSRLREVLCETCGRFFTVCFIKRSDGSERVMHCRTGVTPSPQPSLIQITDYHDLVTVWDVARREFRCIPMEGILWIRLNGAFVRPLRPRGRSSREATTQGLLFAQIAG